MSYEYDHQNNRKLFEVFIEFEIIFLTDCKSGYTISLYVKTFKYRTNLKSQT